MVFENGLGVLRLLPNCDEGTQVFKVTYGNHYFLYMQESTGDFCESER